MLIIWTTATYFFANTWEATHSFPTSTKSNIYSVLVPVQKSRIVPKV